MLLSSWLLERFGGETKRLKIGVTKIGRNIDSDIQILQSIHVSRAHAEITITDDDNQVIIRDLNSVNGIYVNNSVFHNENVRLNTGDIIGIGSIASSSESILNYPTFTLHYVPMRIKQAINQNAAVNAIKQEIFTQVADLPGPTSPILETQNPAVKSLNHNIKSVVKGSTVDFKQTSYTTQSTSRERSIALKLEPLSQANVKYTTKENESDIEVITLSDDDEEDGDFTTTENKKTQMPIITHIKQEYVRNVTGNIKDIFGDTDDVILDKMMDINPYVYNELKNQCDDDSAQKGKLVSNCEYITFDSEDESDKGPKKVQSNAMSSAGNGTNASNNKDNINDDNAYAYVPGSDDEDVEDLMLSQIMYNDMKDDIGDCNDDPSHNDNFNEADTVSMANDNAAVELEPHKEIEERDFNKDLHNCTIWSISDDDDFDEELEMKVSGWSNKLLSQAFKNSQIYDLPSHTNNHNIVSDNSTDSEEADKPIQYASKTNESLIRQFRAYSDDETDCDEEAERNAAALLTVKQLEESCQNAFDKLKQLESNAKNKIEVKKSEVQKITKPKKIAARIYSYDSGTDGDDTSFKKYDQNKSDKSDSTKNQNPSTLDVHKAQYISTKYLYHKSRTSANQSSEGAVTTTDIRHGPLTLIDALPILKKGKQKTDITITTIADTTTTTTHNKKLNSVQEKICLENYKKKLQRKWFEKSAAVNRRDKQKISRIKETRKERLKELAEEKKKEKEKENLKRKLTTPVAAEQNNKKAKVKVTLVNRGAFLIEATKHVVHKQKSTENVSKNSSISYKIPKCNNSMVTNSISERKNVASKGLYNVELDVPFNNMSFSQQIAAPDKLLRKITRTESEMTRAQRTTNKISFASMTRNSFDTEVNKRKLETICYIRSTHSENIASDGALGGKRKNEKIVRFDDNVTVHFIERIQGAWRKVTMKDANPKTTHRDRRHLIRRKYPILDCTYKIVSHILHWSNDWLKNRVSGAEEGNEYVYPMPNVFNSFDHYKSIIFPLMKLEFLSTLAREYNTILGKIKPFKVTLEQVTQSKDRHILITKYTYQNKSMADACRYNLVILDFGKNNCKLFAYMSAYRKGVGNSNSVVFEIIDNDIHIDFLKSLKELSVQPVFDNIRVEFGAFNAVYQLAETPLFQKIINPKELMQCQSIHMDQIVYKGYDGGLNVGQMEALKKSYAHVVDENTPTISLIHGPPGTGKSSVITNLALQLLYGNDGHRMDKKILICAQSNGAVDVIASRLLHISLKMREDIKFRLIRYGILDKMKHSVRPISLQKIVEQNQMRKVLGRNSKFQLENNKSALKSQIEMVEAEIAAMQSMHIKNTFKEHELLEKQQQLDLWKSILNCRLRPEEERNLHKSYLVNANIVCTTLSSCVKLSQLVDYFDVCIIDEATQCTEPWTLLPLKFGISSLVLVGDTQQLPATVLSKKAMNLGLGTSMFTRIQRCLEACKSAENNVIFRLKMQYRMHPEICLWPNKYFYDNALENAPITEQHKTKLKPFCILNLAYSQNEHCRNGKITNNLEAAFVAKLLKALNELLPTKTNSYGVITPYAQHREALLKAVRLMGLDNIMVNTIDSYQGIEKDVIIISNARTCGIGFLSNYQRLNVALTRPRKCLILCGNFKNLETVPAWRSLLQNARERKLYYDLDLNCLKDIQRNVIAKILK